MPPKYQDISRNTVIISSALFWFITQFIIYLAVWDNAFCVSSPVKLGYTNSPYFYVYATCAFINLLFILLLSLLWVSDSKSTSLLTRKEHIIYTLSIGMLASWQYVFYRYWQAFESSVSLGEITSWVLVDFWSWSNLSTLQCI